MNRRKFFGMLFGAAAVGAVAPLAYKTFDQVNHEEAESSGEVIIMDIFFLGVIGFVLVAFVVFVIASLRLERSHRT